MNKIIKTLFMVALLLSVFQVETFGSGPKAMTVSTVNEGASSSSANDAHDCLPSHSGHEDSDSCVLGHHCSHLHCFHLFVKNFHIDHQILSRLLQMANLIQILDSPDIDGVFHPPRLSQGMT